MSSQRYAAQVWRYQSARIGLRAPRVAVRIAPTYLACAQGDYNLSFTSPTRADSRRGYEFVLPIPAHTPRSEELCGPQRPFWQVDVEVSTPRMPSGRNLRALAILADDEAPVVDSAPQRPASHLVQPDEHVRCAQQCDPRTIYREAPTPRPGPERARNLLSHT